MGEVIFVLIKLFFFLLLILNIAAEPVFFNFKNESKKKWEDCYFNSKDAEFKNFSEKNYKEIEAISKFNSSKTILQLECAKKNSTKEEIKFQIEFSFSNLQSELDLFNRFIYSYEKSSLSPLDRQKTTEFVKAKFDLNSVLVNRVQEISEKEDLKFYEEELKVIYASVLVLHRDFFNSISKELRQEIFLKLKISR